MKDFLFEVPLGRGDMDATPQAFHERRFAPWRAKGDGMKDFLFEVPLPTWMQRRRRST
jgi:hypothetical protein